MIQQLQDIYLQLLNHFPAGLRPFVSIALGIVLVYSVFKIVKQDFIWIIALIILLPGSVPILESIWQGIVVFLKFLFNTR